MNKHDAIKFFGTQVKLAAVRGIKQHTISGWGDSPPEIRQLQIEKATGGALKANESIMGKISVLGKPAKKKAKTA